MSHISNWFKEKFMFMKAPLKYEKCLHLVLLDRSKTCSNKMFIDDGP